MKLIAGKPMLQWVVEAAQNSNLVDKVVVATSREKSDDPMMEAAQVCGCDLYRGSLDNVLARFYGVALSERPTYVVRLTADCPLLTGDIIDRVIRVHLMMDFDYTRNAVDGYDVEVFNYDLLLKAAKLATEPEEREHVTTFMRNGDYDWLDTYIPADIVGKYSVDTEDEFDRIEGLLSGRQSYVVKTRELARQHSGCDCSPSQECNICSRNLR